MNVLLYDGSWRGFLTAVFEAFEHKLSDASILRAEHFQPAVFGGSRVVLTDNKKAERVWTGLRKKLSPKSTGDIYSCFLSGLDGIESQLLMYIKLGLSLPGAESAYGNPAILKVSQVSKMVHREKHRMEAFVRFQLTKDNVYYAGIEPDFDVVPLISSHFKNRYADQKWLIYDLRRGYGIYYNLQTIEEVHIEFSEDAQNEDFLFCEEEAVYQSLWKEYFKHVNIETRKNTKLHLRHVPKRYWKHLTEKI
jgi:probable DNA metabolism protein